MIGRLCRRSGLLAAALLVSLPAPAFAAGAGRRVRIALFGDSVTESILINNFEKVGLAPDLDRALTRYGFTAGGEGMVALNPYQWHFSRWTVPGGPAPTPNAWNLTGGATIARTALPAGQAGPSGFSGTATSPLATATTTVSDPEVELLYNTTTVPCTFTVDAAGAQFAIETFAPGPPAAASSTISLPPGQFPLTVHGPNCDATLTFNGIVAHRPVPPGAVQVEVENDGHFGKPPWADLRPEVGEAIAQQRYDISVFLFSYISALYVTPGVLASEYEQAMLTRAFIARLHGGSCLLVAPAPLPAPARAVRLVASIDRSVAAREGCGYTTVLRHIWPTPAYAVNHNLTAVDGFHPTAVGYRLMARALAPVLARMVRARVGR